jgi:hypothetical protein
MGFHPQTDSIPVMLCKSCASLPQWQLRPADGEASHACGAVEHACSAMHHTALRHIAKVDVARAQRQLLACRTEQTAERR